MPSSKLASEGGRWRIGRALWEGSIQAECQHPSTRWQQPPANYTTGPYLSFPFTQCLLGAFKFLPASSLVGGCDATRGETRTSRYQTPDKQATGS